MKYLIQPVTAFGANAVLVWDSKTSKGAIFDPGGEAGRLASWVEKNGVSLQAIYLTHGHIDHVGGALKLKKHFNVPVYIHKDDEGLALQAPQQSLMFGVPMVEAPPIDHNVVDNQELTLGTLKFRVIHTPGHSKGSVCYYFHDQEPPVLVAGDLLFAGSIGRMDLPGGSTTEMKGSLERIIELPGETVVLSGHGPNTTIAREKRDNPYLANGIYL